MACCEPQIHKKAACVASLNGNADNAVLSLPRPHKWPREVVALVTKSSLVAELTLRNATRRRTTQARQTRPLRPRVLDL